jgi:hypothetical protein
MGWNEQAKSQSSVPGAVFKINTIENQSLYKGYKYPVLNIEIGHLPADVPRKNVFLLLFDRQNSQKPYMIALRLDNNEWIGNLIRKDLSPPSFSTIIPQKMPGGQYDATLCWSENDIPKSIVIARDINISGN